VPNTQEETLKRTMLSSDARIDSLLEDSNFESRA